MFSAAMGSWPPQGQQEAVGCAAAARQSLGGLECGRLSGHRFVI